MRASISITKNQREIQEAQSYNKQIEQALIGQADPKKRKALNDKRVEVPPAEKTETPLLFDLKDAKWAFLNEDGNIILKLNDGESFILTYDAKVWSQLEKRFSH